VAAPIPSRAGTSTRPAPQTASVFLTGATGVVGRRVVPLLVARGHRVTAAGRSAEKLARLEAAGAKTVAAGLFDAAALGRAIEGAQADVVVNLATHIPSAAWRMLLPGAWRENDRIRRDGSAAVARAAREAGASGFVQESFAPIYEGAGEAWIDESAPVRPAPYNRSVLDAERASAGFTGDRRRGVALRFAGFYGPDPFLESLLGSVRRGWAPLPGPPGAYWSALAQDDAASAVVAVVEALVARSLPAGVYNVCDDEPLTRDEFAATLAAALGVGKPRPMPGWLARLGGASIELLSRSQRISNARLAAATGWSPAWSSARTGLPEAIRELATLRAG
jgi:nucleoside-diphosphate-sugar epimerase